jgi:SAM-dependent methyltransferase
MGQEATLSFARKYGGYTADVYESRRVGKKWDSENEAVQELLEYIPEGSKVLDCPVGTGRLFRYFNARKFQTSGLDASADMLEQARMAAEKVGGTLSLKEGDIRSLPFPDGSFDLVVCVRFLNLIKRDGVEVVVPELTRVSGDKILIGIRYIAPLSDLRPKADDLVRLASRPLWLAKWLLRGSDMVIHKKKFVTGMIKRCGLTVVQTRYVERRWDGTDYVMLLLQKPAASK